MTDTVETKEELLEKFYENYFFFSYSSLNKLLHSPQLFYNWYILREREDSLEVHLMEGKVIHCLLLDKNMFDEQFMVMPGDLPGVSNKKIVESMYRMWQSEKKISDLKGYEVEILKWLEDNNLHQSLKDDKDLTKEGAKTGDQKRMEKVLTTKSRDYFEYLKASENKDVISQETLDRCEEAVNIIKENSVVTDLLRIGQEGFELTQIYNEVPIACQLQGLPFGLKGIVDNYVIDHSTKTVNITDLKTSSKTLAEFKDSLEYYKYWMQAAVYERLVSAKHPEVKDYEFVFHFVVIDKYNQVYPFPVTKESMLDWQSQLEKVLEIAKYHYTNKDYKLPYEFAMDQVTL